MVKSVKMRIGDGELVLETGKMARQANGAIYAHYEGSAVLATVCSGNEPETPLDYVPLQVEYNEKYYAAGKIPGGFLKREGRPKDKEILVSRLIDRPMRPLFDKAFGREIQIVPTVVSSDMVHTPDIIAMIASSAAVVISDIPFNGPTAAVRVGYIDGEFVINPTFQQIEEARLEIIVAGTVDGITMVEGGGKQVSEELLLEAIEKAQPVIADLCKLQLELAKMVGKEKLPLMEVEEAPAFLKEIEKYAYPHYEKASFVKGKMERYAALDSVKKDVKEKFAEQIEESGKGDLVDDLFEELEYTILRSSILDKGVRTDGRKADEVRDIICDVGILPRTHGSALFTRGETQSLATITLGTASDEQMFDTIDGDKHFSNFMLHYNFPPFSVGETGRLGTGRREIGHGHLAQRALETILPSKEDFPYTIRIVSEILESNGSSSMASVCGGTLALMDGGVNIDKPVAGIAMGLITADEKFSKYAVLSDILGEEDHLGDMDFKVAGTREGITAFQMDIKIAGVSQKVMQEALHQAKEGRLHILDVMEKAIGEPREDISELAPKILTLRVDEEKIGAVIGTGGKTIKGIAEQTGAEINIENDGLVTIYGRNKASAQEAYDLVKSIVEEPEVGRIYQGTVKRIMDFGAFVEILPGKEGLVHISKMAKTRVNNVNDILSVNQVIPVKLMEIDRQDRLNLSYIDALEETEKQ